MLLRPIAYAAALTLIGCFLSQGEAQISARTDNAVSKYPDALEAIFGIGIRSTAILADPNTTGNVIVSPVSIALLLGQLMLGAEEDFLKQLYNLLSLKQARYTDLLLNRKTGDKIYLPYASLHLQMWSLLNDLRRPGERNFTLHESSALFYDRSIQLKDRFTNNLRMFYRTEIKQLNFTSDPVKSLQIMNNWADTQTNGLIKQILANPPTGPNAAVFTNALYFLGEWKTPFSDELNRRGKFSTDSKAQVDVTYMLGFLEDVKYAETPLYKMVCLPYRNEELGMYILLPNEDNEYIFDIRRFQQTLNESEIMSTIANARRYQSVIKLPKMQLTSTISILKPLQKYVAYKKKNAAGVQANDTLGAANKLQELVQDYINFNATEVGDVELSGAASNANLQVSDIVQQLTLSVNEKGTEAAAVTAAAIDYMGGSKSFLVDRPFIFFIWHETTRIVLFWGAITDPTK